MASHCSLLWPIRLCVSHPPCLISPCSPHRRPPQNPTIRNQPPSQTHHCLSRKPWLLLWGNQHSLFNSYALLRFQLTCHIPWKHSDVFPPPKLLRNTSFSTRNLTMIGIILYYVLIDLWKTPTILLSVPWGSFTKLINISQGSNVVLSTW